MKAKQRIYLDNCCFNRPFDLQSQIRVRLESEAKLYIQEQVKEGHLELIWSYILHLENQANPHHDRRNAIAKWQSLATLEILESSELLTQAESFAKMGIKAKDALHAAVAIQGKADFFITTDDKLLSKLAENDNIRSINPLNFIQELQL